MKESRYGVISTAGIAKRFIPAVRESGGVVLAAASRNIERAREFCIQNDISKAYGSYRELYNDPGINIVYIATTNQTHVTEIKEALSHGKHVVCEKPLVLTKKDAIDVFALARKKGLFLMEAQKSVFLPVTDLVKSYIDHKELGALHQISMIASFESPAAPWMHEPQQGGVVYGSASYTIEYLDYLLDSDEIQVQTLGTMEESGTVDAVSINMKINEVLINSKISMRAPAESYAIFYFEQGYIKIKDYWKARECEIYSKDNKEIRSFPEKYEMRYEVEHINDCLKKGLIQSPIMSEERTVKCCEIVERIIQEL